MSDPKEPVVFRYSAFGSMVVGAFLAFMMAIPVFGGAVRTGYVGYAIMLALVVLLEANQVLIWINSRIELFEDHLVSTNWLRRNRSIPYTEISKVIPASVRGRTTTQLVCHHEDNMRLEQGLVGFRRLEDELNRRCNIPQPVAKS